MEKLVDYLKEVFAWLKKQPIIGPAINILNSRKGLIASALTVGILRYLPELEKVHGELDVVVLALVTIGVAWVATSLGYAIEDAAAKGAGTAVINTVSTPDTTVETKSSVSTESEVDDSGAVG